MHFFVVSAPFVDLKEASIFFSVLCDFVTDKFVHRLITRLFQMLETICNYIIIFEAKLEPLGYNEIQNLVRFGIQFFGIIVFLFLDFNYYQFTFTVPI